MKTSTYWFLTNRAAVETRIMETTISDVFLAPILSFRDPKNSYENVLPASFTDIKSEASKASIPNEEPIAAKCEPKEVRPEQQITAKMNRRIL